MRQTPCVRSISIVLGVLIGFVWEWLREARIRSTSGARAREVAKEHGLGITVLDEKQLAQRLAHKPHPPVFQVKLAK